MQASSSGIPILLEAANALKGCIADWKKPSIAAYVLRTKIAKKPYTGEQVTSSSTPMTSPAKKAKTLADLGLFKVHLYVHEDGATMLMTVIAV